MVKHLANYDNKNLIFSLFKLLDFDQTMAPL